MKIKEDRSDGNGVEMWYPLMMRYLNESPYGQKCEFVSISDMVAHFKLRTGLELRIVKEILGGHSIIIPAKAYDIEGLENLV